MKDGTPKRESNPPPLKLIPRFSLYRKIVAAFVIIILFMGSASFFVLFQLRGGFSAEQKDIIQIQLAQQLSDIFDAENLTARKYFTSRSFQDQQMFDLMRSRFVLIKDSVLQMADQEEVKNLIQDISSLYDKYEKFLLLQTVRMRKNFDYDALEEMEKKQLERDSITAKLNSLKLAYFPFHLQALKSREKKTSDTSDAAVIVMILSLIVAIVITWFVARTLTKPIQALKAGTEKVGEGHYETVPLTSNDEIADLTLAFNLMSEKLRQLDEMRMQLMSEISHEMRTPLQVIKAGCYSLVHTKDGPSLVRRQRDAVGMIHQATNRINQFVNSFLDVAKMEAGLMKFKFEDTSLLELLNPLIQEVQLIAQTRKIKLEFYVDQIPTIMVDRDRMNQVFSNLLSNALKYTPDEGCITVRINKISDCEGIAKNSRGCIKIDVQDSGVGIPESDLDKLFNKFYQAKNVPLINEKGSGLGLALVKHVTRAHGGKVDVKSQVGVGSTFTVVLPA